MKVSPARALVSHALAQDREARHLHWQHLVLLAVLSDHPKPLSLYAMAELIDLSPSQVSRLVKRLVEGGFVVRNLDPADARRHTLTPTTTGRALCERVNTITAAITAAVNPTPQLATEESP